MQGTKHPFDCGHHSSSSAPGETVERNIGGCPEGKHYVRWEAVDPHSGIRPITRHFLSGKDSCIQEYQCIRFSRPLRSEGKRAKRRDLQDNSGNKMKVLYR